MINIIDIGSNTIRLVTYDKGKSVSNYGMASEIISDTKNGILSEKGIEKLCKTVSELKKLKEDEEIFAFGTYAIRVLRNRENVVKRVFDETGIKIDVLSGKQEAEYDFYGLLGTISKKESGIGVDLGGGSAQILIFNGGKLTSSMSRPIGCRRVKNRFSKGKKLEKSEIIKLREYIQKNLETQKGKKTGKIYMMGGTAKSALKLYRFLSGENADIIKVSEIENILKFIDENDEKVIKKIFKSRYDNIAVGIVIMREIAEFFGSNSIHVKKCGVRDGYVTKINEKIQK
ncbi:MAG: hypothetical protein IJR79_00560 [Clostridia bacterium]|nr:hypothetical protein [Clostridia bacterium]